MSKPTFRRATLADGAAMWRIARDSRVLDLNTSYAYLIMARDFGEHSSVVEVDGEVVGFCMSYLRPADPSTLFVWQIAVDSSQRGKGLAGRLLEETVRATGATALESTVTADNDASNALFAGFAARSGATETITEFITPDHFPADDVHGAELLHRIEPLPGA
ncbi:L-2,4-diaminobutyric acid acetyltransferase [Kytococcus aerolatus]|uniref:L-2,4-diaminobutyric acid acetyltransferase n=1 Tax=Kytococcus aerolatus TaxID=592308 RepID=A0A212T7Y0_9MICO|nr:diaminobutyrate acetyltransferase [Kytococcus aerolatus]SNC62163.1 L-2,4-diaminobutyric acid acetyltransferase [Kytococcus aerolatus]